MEIQAHIEALEEQGEILARGASRSGLDQQVPTCPEWALRDLLQHVGDIHRWATVYVSTARTTMLSDDEEKLLFGQSPDDTEMVDWFRRGHQALCQALRAAPSDLECWTFMAAPSPLAFWARRQAHETTMHRVDVESVEGVLTPISAALASDGIDELLNGFAARGGKLLRDPAKTMLVESIDTSDRWLVTLGTERVSAQRFTSEGSADNSSGGGSPGGGSALDADCVVSGKAFDVYLTLWNRLPLPESDSKVETTGEDDVLYRFCESLRVK